MSDCGCGDESSPKVAGSIAAERISAFLEGYKRSTITQEELVEFIEFASEEIDEVDDKQFDRMKEIVSEADQINGGKMRELWLETAKKYYNQK